LGRDAPDLAEVCADRIQDHHALPHQQIPAPVQHQNTLLILALDRHKANAGSGHGFADRLRV
jgi:hypothetical protein